MDISKIPLERQRKSAPTWQGAGENFILTRDNMPKLKEQLQQAIKQMADFEKLKSHIEMTVTTEGLRIELSESASWNILRQRQRQTQRRWQRVARSPLAQELGKLPNKLSIEGHTDSKPYAPSATYGNWELSVRSRQRGPPRHASQRHPRGPGHAGPRLCRPATCASPTPPSTPRTAASR